MERQFGQAPETIQLGRLIDMHGSAWLRFYQLISTGIDTNHFGWTDRLSNVSFAKVVRHSVPVVTL